MRSIKGGIPQITGNEKEVNKALQKNGDFYAPLSAVNFNNVESSFGIALHMHQPTIPASDQNIAEADLISNLQHMMENQHIHDNHNAPVFLQCYSRMSDIIRGLVDSGKNPRVMLDYSGNLFWGLKQMGEEKVLDNLKRIANDKKYYPCVEWLGTMWSHAVVSSTPIPDIKLHIRAWQEHFASIFGYDALSRVKGFSPPEMHLPIHPDVCYEYVKALKECGYEWFMVQEHTVENLDGSGIQRPFFPHRLLAKNSAGDEIDMTVLIKTKGSDTKLVGQMQPYYEALTKKRESYAGKSMPPYVLQIGDGENGGVMMNEFPQAYRQAFDRIGRDGVISLNGTEYLEFLRKDGIDFNLFTPIQPVSQHRIWNAMDKHGKGACDKAIEKVKKKDSGFNLDKASWTSDKNWVRGYSDVLDPINRLSAKFHEYFDEKNIDPADDHYKNSLLYLLLSQTSCFRYWGSGVWTDYAKEICKRGLEEVTDKR